MRVAKRVRTETEIGQAMVGVGSAGVDLSKQIFGDLVNRRAMLIGVGDMGLEVSRALQRAGLDELVIVNRTFENAVKLASDVGGTPVAMERMAEYLPRVDIVLAATAANSVILRADTVRQALRKRKYKPLFLMDLAVPRNIDPAIDDLDAAFLFNVDDLSGIVEQGRQAREAASADAEQMIEKEVTLFFKLMSDVEMGPTISALTQRVEDLRLQELERSKKLLDGLSEEQREGLDKLTMALMKKVLHGPLKNLREAGREGDAEQIQRICDLWKEE